MGKDIIFGRAGWEDYEKAFLERLTLLKEKGVEAGVFGDIDLQEHRDWVELVCEEVGMEAVLPSWKRGREELLEGKDMPLLNWIDKLIPVRSSGPCLFGRQESGAKIQGPLETLPV